MAVYIQVSTLPCLAPESYRQKIHDVQNRKSSRLFELSSSLRMEIDGSIDIDLKNELPRPSLVIYNIRDKRWNMAASIVTATV